MSPPGHERNLDSPLNHTGGETVDVRANMMTLGAISARGVLLELRSAVGHIDILLHDSNQGKLVRQPARIFHSSSYRALQRLGFPVAVSAAQKMGTPSNIAHNDINRLRVCSPRGGANVIRHMALAFC